MPYIASIMRKTVKLAKAHYYGFMNNDVLFETSLFPALTALTKHRKHQSLGAFVTLVFNTYNLMTTPRIQFNTTNIYEEFFDKSVREANDRKRPSYTSDLIIFSKEFVRYPLRDDIVIGRPRVDNYLMSYTVQNHGQLVFGRYAGNRFVHCMSALVRTLHQGWTTYKERVYNREKNDINWNINLVQQESITTRNALYAFCIH